MHAFFPHSLYGEMVCLLLCVVQVKREQFTVSVPADTVVTVTNIEAPKSKPTVNSKPSQPFPAANYSDDFDGVLKQL